MSGAEEWLRELSHSWPLLGPSVPTEIATSALPLTFDEVGVRLGVDGQGARHLLVPILEGDAPEADTTESTLSLSVRTYTFGRRPHRYVDVSCSRSDVFDLFDEVLVDVLTSIATACESPGRTSSSVVGRWRTLLATGTRRLLTLTAQMSLIGELYVLDLVHRGRPIDISTWRGPLREPHDIVLPACALEIKAAGSTATFVEIHGLLQLQPPGVPLALVVARVVEAAHGTTLPQLVDRVLARCSNRREALVRIAAAGFGAADADRYGQTFSVEELAFLEVDESVPRIVPNSFASGYPPQGVDAVNYRVMLDSLDPLFARGESALLEWATDAAS